MWINVHLPYRQWFSVFIRKRRDVEKQLMNAPTVDPCRKSASFVDMFYYNCSGDYRDVRALIGQELRHISV